jgi:hypothetical protein
LGFWAEENTLPLVNVDGLEDYQESRISITPWFKQPGVIDSERNEKAWQLIGQ